jgi:hypothetical protein
MWYAVPNVIRIMVTLLWLAWQCFGDVCQAVSYEFSNLGLEYSLNCNFLVLCGCNTSSLTPHDNKCRSLKFGHYEGADKSLARPTSRCCRTKSIVSLERGGSSCAKLQVFSCYRG